MRRSRGSGRRRAPATRRGRSSRPASSRRATSSCRRARSASARRRTRRSRSAAGGRTRWRAPASASRARRARGRGVPLRRSCGETGDRRGFEIECSTGTYVRSLIAALGDAYCEQLRRTRDRAVRRRATPTPSGSCRSSRRSTFLPEVRLDAEQARRAGHGESGPGRSRRRPARMVVEAHRRRRADRARRATRAGGVLKPIVGLRG